MRREFALGTPFALTERINFPLRSYTSNWELVARLDESTPGTDGQPVRCSFCKRGSILDHLESEVIKLRYSLQDGYTYTIDEIGEQFGIKPERVAEIEQRSIDKLRMRTVTPDQ
jgi:Sigma-70, region 4